jgi:beta-galactosidase
VQEGEVMLDACNTDWRKWNKRPEELKTAAILRSENEAKGASPVFACYQKDGSTYLVSTLTHFADTEKGSNSLTQILRQLGIPLDTSESLAAKDFFDAQGFLLKSKRSTAHTGELSFWLFSPRPLDDLLIEPNVPKVDITVHATNGARIWLNNKQLSDSGNDNQTQCNELPLQQGWNFFLIKTRTKGEPFSVRFQSLNRPEFMSLLKGSFSNPDGEQK